MARIFPSRFILWTLKYGMQYSQPSVVELSGPLIVWESDINGAVFFSILIHMHHTCLQIMVQDHLNPAQWELIQSHPIPILLMFTALVMSLPMLIPAMMICADFF